MEASEAKRLGELEAENAKLKRIVADQMLDMSARLCCANRLMVRVLLSSDKVIPQLL